MKYRNDLKKRILAGLLAGAALCLTAPAAQAANVVPNTQLPQLPNGVSEDAPFFAGTGNITRPGDAQMNVNQTSQNGVIKWDGFNIGANATVNFKGPENFNTLNYDISGSLSQIYGTINAQGGNIYIVNPAGVEIGNSAQINTGSLYVSNKNLDDKIYEGMDIPQDMDAFVRSGQSTDAALMSLGNINANTVTFEGSRIVIDTERIKDESGDNKLVDIDNGQNITIRTTNENNVVIGYKGYDEDKKAYNTQEVTYNVTKIDEKGNVIDDAAKVAGYMWVEDVEQLQAIGASADTLKGNYVLRNSIDATATKDWTGTFNPLGGTGQNGDDNPFTGKFDGLDYNIFNLNINRADENYVGLFGVVGSGAVINNVTLVGGSITGQNYVGSLAGTVQDGASISNITNSAKVNGSTSVGGIIGQSGNYSPSGKNEGASLENLINTGTVTGDTNNIGGLVGNMQNGTLGGTSYNLGAVTAKGYNVGGLVGHAMNATLGDGTNQIYNRLNVTGAYNVGGIVGNMEGSTVQNAENSGSVLAINHKEEVYSYHTGDNTYDTMGGSAADGIGEVEVYIANVGGIAGSSSALGEQESTISNVLNLGDVSSSRQEGNEYYDAGNVGGVVGRAENTNIENATNRENEIRGAHNVGGIAGYFGGSGTVTNGINDGGDIMATGARAAAGGTHNNAATTPADDNVFYGYNVSDTGYALEHVRNGNTGRETVVVGNIGGIVGYMDGDEVYIASSANRGTVHSQEFTGTVPDSSKAANAGGIVGKIDRSSTKNISELEEKYVNAAVSNSYNTGDVRGYTGVGGIAGMMYNGEIAGSYNLGTVNTTRQPASSNATAYETVNMGGIVGDTTEGTKASALLYDVYNKGQIGDETFNYYARHVGGIVGRLSGTVEKAYNMGDIYNGYNVVGGIAGWFAKGTINNSFNTGNITVANKENSAAGVQAGGIAGGASTGQTSISNVYNLGTIRGFQTNGYKGGAVGGIVGAFIGDGEASISNAYTTGNLYLNIGGSGAEFRGGNSSTVGLGSIYGSNGNYTQTVNTENTYYIRPDNGLPFTDLSANNRDNSDKAIAFDKKDDITEYQYGEGENHHQLFQTSTKQNEVNEGDAWRIYDGSTPILNAFLPNAKDYFDKEDTDKTGIGSIQYGTAYDPLLTIVNAAKDTANLTFNWQDLGINNDAGLAVYGAGLTLNDFMATGGSGYFAGLIYSDGALTLNAHTSDTTTGNVALGSASELYGSSVAINADGQVTIYGSVTATGNTQDGTSWDETQKKYTGTIDVTDGSISITGGNVDVYGQLTSAKDKESVRVPGINGMAEGWNPAEHGNVADPNAKMSDIGDRFGYTTQPSDTLAQTPGNISITANDAEDGHVNVYYGNKGEGIVTTGGALTVTASGDIYMDSDLSIGGDLSLKAGYKEGEDKPAAGSEAVLDISNIGQVRANGDKDAALSYLNEFLTHFADGTHNITLGGDKTKLAVDMWGDGAFDLTKYDYDGYTLAERINALNLSVNGTKAKGQDYTYIWVSTGEQLAGIQDYKDKHQDSNILSYNFALKNDIDASNVRDYKAIASGEGEVYTGIFDGRDNRIIGLDTTKKADGSSQTLTNAGIFDTVGAGGTVEDLRVYSGTFTGTTNAGAVAGVNEGTISNVTAFGNVVQSAGNAGGIAGTNSGTISNGEAIGTATAEGENAIAGGIAGTNTNTGKISDSSANSAVNASAGNATALGGVAGVNEGKLDNVDSLGVTTGIYKVEGKDTLYSDNVGGIAGTNSGVVTNVYNESIVSGRDNVGGILGVNTATTTEDEGSPVSNVANASRVTGEADSSSDTNNASDYVGGLVGNNEGSITNGRNNGEITGNNYVGGLVGSNGANSTLTNLVNDSAAAITGDNYVGGIAGSNEGTISAKNQTNLINRGSITGQNYVGGVAGENIGTIEYVESDISLNVRYEDQEAKYFGGVVGINGRLDDGTTTEDESASGTITNAKNTATITAENADYVGGIVGWNTEKGILSGAGNSNTGDVTGHSYVGGVAGRNDAAIGSADGETVGISNEGKVTALEGGAGGIFGYNKKDVTNAHLISKGIVTGTSGDGSSGTGGIFGVNSGNITDSILENLDGTVTGTSNTGGLIGINTGNVSTSSLKNEADITVTAEEGQTVTNIGGLIGQNSGDITGGRTDVTDDGQTVDNGYYKYQIYNNGTITVKGDGSNIGGLVGSNQKKTDGTGGTITAGYNTGAIEASGSTNVGGIAGTNAGTLDQVFNTVITVNGEGSITGSTNVGGIAGTNTGSIFNAYNTTTVTGTTNTGSIAGVNDNFISNVYGSGTLVGSGNAATHVYDSENGFDEENEDGSVIDKDGTVSDAPWRQYGDNNPILKVFLTTVTYDGTKNNQDLVYNGKDQTLDIDGLIDSGAFGAADDFAAHKNVEGGLIFHDVDGEHQNAGKYTDDLWSVQIGAGKDGSPNNLGYDVQSVEYNIERATIDVSLDDIYRLYGSGNMYKDADRTQGSNAYEDYWHITVGNADDFDQDALNAALESIRKNAEITDDGKGTNGRTTADAGDHDWKVQVDIFDIASNFQLNGQEDATSYTYEGANQSHVAKADLTIDLNDVNMTYGQKEDDIRGQYGYSASTEAGKTLVNGDTLADVIADMQYTNTAYNEDGTTKDVLADGTYALEKDTVTEGDAYKNYNVTYTNGDVTMEKASVVISADDKEMHVGDTIPAFTGTDISSKLVNGDTLSGWYYGPEGTVDSSVGGSHIIGVHFDNGEYAGSDSFDWTTAWDGFKNYNVTFTPGMLTVRDFPEGMPDIPEIPGIENHWNGLLGDNPWDRNRDFRERKAEIHYIAGGMTL